MEAHGFTGGLSLDEALDWEDSDAGDLAGPGGPGLWELVALVTLVIGGTGLPVIGWLVGMLLVQLSDVWTQRDKTVAVLLPAVAVGLAVIASAAFGPGGTPILELGPLAVLLLFGGMIAGCLGGAYLTVRAFVLA
jgi:hypothetical protein